MLYCFKYCSFRQVVSPCLSLHEWYFREVGAGSPFKYSISIPNILFQVRGMSRFGAFAHSLYNRKKVGSTIFILLFNL